MLLVNEFLSKGKLFLILYSIFIEGESICMCHKFEGILENGVRYTGKQCCKGNGKTSIHL